MPNSNSTNLWAVVALPPPVTGMTLLTEKVVETLGHNGLVKILNISPGTTRRGLGFRLRRSFKTVVALCSLGARGPVNGATLYISSNSGAGLALTGLLVALACRLGYRVYLHHHSYAYISKSSRWMVYINHHMGTDSVHIVHCDKMVDDFRSQYNPQSQFFTLYPSVVSLRLGWKKDRPGEVFCLGHLSNLTVAKGIDLVLQTFEMLKANGRRVRLKLAGPLHCRAAKRLIETAVSENQGLVEYSGAIYGDAKEQFYKELDAFLFPTRYENESWGIVLNEALAGGVPVISLKRGCTATVVGAQAGLIVERESDFVAEAIVQISKWIDTPSAYAQASCAALEQARWLTSEGQQQLQQLAANMFRPALTSGVEAEA